MLFCRVPACKGRPLPSTPIDMTVNQTELRQYGPQLMDMLMAGAMKLTKNREDAEDLMQETLLKAYSNKDKYQEGSNLGAWLFVIMKNTFITQVKSQARRKQLMDKEIIPRWSKREDMGAVHSQLAYKDIMETLDRIPSRYRVPFLLFYQGYKYDEIAQRLQRPVGTIKNYIYIARQQVKAMGLKAHPVSDRAYSV